MKKQMKNRSTPSTRGFTLLEVLIAVLIVGIIATAAIPMLSDYTEQARDARMVANVQALDRAVQRYELDHQAPWGFVYEPLSEDGYIPYNWEGGLAFVEQLEKPTDAYGNVLGDPGSSVTGPCVHGPYVSDAFAPAALLLGAAVGQTLSDKDGLVAIIVRETQECEPDVRSGVLLDDGYYFKHGVTTKETKEIERGGKPAFVIVHATALKNAPKLQPRGRTIDIEEERRVRRNSEYERLKVMLNKPRLTQTEENDLHEWLTEWVRELRDAMSVSERDDIVSKIREAVASRRLGDPIAEAMRLIITGQINRWERDGDEVRRHLIAGSALQMIAYGATAEDVGRMRDWIVVLSGKGAADTWEEEWNRIPLRSAGALPDPEAIRERSRPFYTLVERGVVVSDGVNHGFDEFLKMVAKDDAGEPNRLRPDVQERLLYARRNLDAAERLDRLQAEVRAAVAKTDRARVDALLAEFRSEIDDTPDGRRIQDLLMRALVSDVPRIIEVGSEALRSAHEEKAKREYEELRDGRVFPNDSARGHALQTRIGVGRDNLTITGASPGHGSRGQAKPVVVVGSVRQGRGAEHACRPTFTIGKITTLSVEGARARKRMTSAPTHPPDKG